MINHLRPAVLASLALTLIAHSVRAAEPIDLQADLTEAPRGLIRAKLTIPVKPGPLTLVYPQWIPGYHSPIGPVTDIAGLKFTTSGKPVTWHRDLVDMYAVKLDIPAGATRLEAELEYLAPTGGSGNDPSTSSQLTILEWNLVALYPKGTDAAKIMVKPSVILPTDWKFGCSMPVVPSPKAGMPGVYFEPLSLEMLIDQPLLAGRYFKQIDLTPGTKPEHVIDIAADSEAALAMTPARVQNYQRVPGEFAAMFAGRHYDRYHFLLTLSDRTGYNGLEHHQCSDNRSYERTLIDEDIFRTFGALLTHEYFHSWNGKHRRGAGQLSPDYQKPMEGDLLWVYEGLTEYYGDVMAARAGLWSPEEYRDNLALISASQAARLGRTWRPLQDTADMAPKLYQSGRNWSHRRRGTDFYDEGELIWLDADTLIRQKTDGKKSLDDFCRAFHGEGSGNPGLGGVKPTVAPYTADDVFATLHKVYPYDWKTFFTKRLQSLDPQPPLAGLAQGGWKLVFNSTPNKMLDALNKSGKKMDLRFSLGLIIDTDDNTVIDVVPDSPADKAGIGPNMKILGVNGRKFDDDLLKDAIAATPKTGHIDLLLENASYFTNAKLNYNGGPRYPHLERITDTKDNLTNIITPRTKP